MKKFKQILRYLYRNEIFEHAEKKWDEFKVHAIEKLLTADMIQNLSSGVQVHEEREVILETLSRQVFGALKFWKEVKKNSKSHILSKYLKCFSL